MANRLRPRSLLVQGRRRVSGLAHFLGIFMMWAICFCFWLALTDDDWDPSRMPAPGKEWIGSVVALTMIGMAWMLIAWR